MIRGLVKLYRFLFLHPDHPGALLCLAIVMVGMVSNNVVMSVGSLGLIGWTLLTPRIGDNFRRFFANRSLMLLTLPFFIYLISGLNSADTGYWSERLLLKLPFLGLPVAFAAIHPWRRGIFMWVSGGFFAMLCGYAIVLLGQYAIHMDDWAGGYLKGNIMPTPMNHIRFSLIMAFGAGLGMYMLALRRGWVDWPGTDSKAPPGFGYVDALVAAGVLLIAIYLHLLAVRSGLVALYLVSFFLIIWTAWCGLGPRWALGMLVLLVAGGILAVRYVPSLNNRLAYARYDLKKFREGDVKPGLSDAKRIASILAGVDITKRHPVMGCGIGDLPVETREFYTENFPDLAPSNPLPHNQFVTVAAGTGLLGLLLFLAALAAPLLHTGALRNPLLVAQQLVVLPSLLSENGLETQLGVTFYIIFTLFCLNHVDACRKSAAPSPPS